MEMAMDGGNSGAIGRNLLQMSSYRAVHMMEGIALVRSGFGVARAGEVVGKDIVALRSKKTWGCVGMVIARNGKMNLKENGNLLGMEVGEEEVVQVSPGSLGMMTPMTEIRMALD